jgi:tetratricopeptide (TPR) repeat protein
LRSESRQFQYVAASLLCVSLSAANAADPAEALQTLGIPSLNDASPELIFQQQDEPELVAPDTTAYQFYIADMEGRDGPYAAGLSEQLLGLGNVYQNQGLHEAAIKVFKRGVHISRVNSGLQGAGQIPLLQGMIRSLVAQGKYDKADEKQYYLYRVQRKVYKAGAPQMSNAMLEHAAWERQAYYLTVGDVAFTRLLTMWELYGAALSNIAKSAGNYSVELLEPLGGLLQTQYMISSYSGEPQSQFVAGGFADANYRDENRFSGIRASNYKQGQSVIAALREVYDYNDGEESTQSARTWVQMGDWHQWHGKRESALEAYLQAWDEFEAMDDGSGLLTEYFGSPVLLPDLPGVPRDLVPPEQISGYAEVSYYINPRGRLKSVEVLKMEPADGTESRPPVGLLRQLKRMHYRPVLVDREPTATETIHKRYAY